MTQFFAWIFIVSAAVFNLLIAGVFLATRAGKMKLVRRIGTGIVLLGIPFSVLLINQLINGRSQYVRIGLAVVLAYILTEWVLDFVLKYDFRARFITHFPYILLEYAAFIALIYIGFTINPITGWVVSVTFWIAMAALIYYLAGRKKSAKQNAKKQPRKR